MSAQPSFECPPRPTVLFITLLLASALGLLRAASSFAQPAIHPGRWTPPDPTPQDFTAVHMALLPSPEPTQYHSKIIWWQEGEHELTQTFGGKVWKWSPTVQNDCSSYPGQNFVEETLTPPGTNIFCAGASPFDGKLFVSGGTEVGEAGARTNVIFNPAGNSWTSGGLMSQFRWYGTVTALPNDGRALILSGSKYHHLEIFGGKDNSGASHGELNRFGMNFEREVGGGDSARDRLARGAEPSRRGGHEPDLRRRKCSWVTADRRVGTPGERQPDRIGGPEL